MNKTHFGLIYLVLYTDDDNNKYITYRVSPAFVMNIKYYIMVNGRKIQEKRKEIENFIYVYSVIYSVKMKNL